MRIALMGTGRGMLFSAQVVAGFLCYFVPEFGAFREVGLLASWTMFIALLANLFPTPSLVLSLQPIPAGPASPAETSEVCDARDGAPAIASSPTDASPA